MSQFFDITHHGRQRLELETALHENMSFERFKHSCRVARTAAIYAGRLGLSIPDAWIAGMAHDLAREWPSHQLLQFVISHDGLIANEFHNKPLLLHGRAAAIILEKNFGMHNSDVLEAMEHHTLGRAGLSALAKLIFVADYLEPGRKFTSLAFRRSMGNCCLDCLVCRVIEHCARRHKDIHPLTLDLYAESSKRCATDSCPGLDGQSPHDRQSLFSGDKIIS